MWAAKHCSILFSSILHQPERFYACIRREATLVDGGGGGGMMAAVPNHAPIRNANPNAIGGFSKTPLIFTHF